MPSMSDTPIDAPLDAPVDPQPNELPEASLPADEPGDGPSDADAAPEQADDINRVTALYGLHTELGAKVTPFAGYDMPLHYEHGILKEHLQVRASAGLFDVSHMGQAFLRARKGGHEAVAAAIERLVPGNIKDLKPGRARYTVLLNDEGGIIDDLMVMRPAGEANDGLLFLVVNASRKERDYEEIASVLDRTVELIPAADRALLALQGPKAAEVLARHAPFVADKPFMSITAGRVDGIECLISRTGYTGEDGFEISVANPFAEPLARALLAHDEVEPIGLGARDSLRLEAGLCLYGQDIDEATSPAEAGIGFVVGKDRREAQDFPGAERICEELQNGPQKCRVGLAPEGRAPARPPSPIKSPDGDSVGHITSGVFGPTAGAPVSVGYVDSRFAAAGTSLAIEIRGRLHPATVVPLPFVPHAYFKPQRGE
ncbi:MAG: glycine cleavage system aminomethyltransferase GcvT [Pseudomonadota bacterium]